MPMHDWKLVPATIYHHFHQRWTISICDALNAALLPPGYSALVEQYSSGLYPDVLAVQRRNSRPSSPRAEMTTLEAPRTRMIVHPREASAADPREAETAALNVWTGGLAACSRLALGHCFPRETSSRLWPSIHW
jgi:hypothetical protein